MTLTRLPLPVKILATCVLLTMSIGYCFAVAYLYLSSVEPHAAGGLVHAIITKYHGAPSASRLESALEGTMQEFTTDEERTRLLRWVREGASEAEFIRIQPILMRACDACHSSSAAMGLAPLTTYADVAEFTRTDLGQSIKTLARISHVHLFGMTFVFALTGVVFAFSERPWAFKAVLIALPFVAIWMDIGSWWVTKYAPLFAYTVIAGGVLMGLSLAAQVLLSLYEMWRRGPLEQDPGSRGVFS